MYTSIKSVLSRINLPEDQYESDDIIEWAMQGLDITNIPNAYQQEMAVLDISNHKAKLPCGITQIEIVVKALNKPIDNKLLDEVSQCNIDYINKQHVDRIQEYGIINNYNLFVSSNYFKNYFEILRMKRKPLMKRFHCSTCPNLTSTCNSEYYIDNNNTIITSFECGQICIGYLKHAVDENGDFLIPDEENLIQGLAYYSMAKHWEQRANTKEENALNMHIFYLNKAQTLLAKARGIYISKSFNITDYNNIVY